jgi:tellurium resistance protein TerD
MGLVTGPAAGTSTKLEITRQSQERVLIGLSWDARDMSKKELRQQKLSGLKDALKGGFSLLKGNLTRLHEKLDEDGRDANDLNFDLDLICFIYDADGNYISAVDQEAWTSMDDTGHVYHSGEDMVGSGGPDDEQIYIHTKNLPIHIHELFFIVLSDCAHAFKDVLNPMVHVTDSYSNKPLLKVEIDKLPDSDKYAFVFCRICRDGEDWAVQNISQFTEFEQDWPQVLKQYRP